MPEIQSTQSHLIERNLTKVEVTPISSKEWEPRVSLQSKEASIFRGFFMPEIQSTQSHLIERKPCQGRGHAY